jgi:small-conductance mechanosensitive channel
MFETRSQAWQEVGLQRQIDSGELRRARWEALILVPLFIAVVILFDNRVGLFGGSHDTTLEPALEAAVTAVTVVVLMILGWAIARDFGRALGPALFRRMEPATAGTVGFIIRLLTVLAALLVALAVAGVKPGVVLAVGGTFTAVISIVLGLAAQQTLGNFFAGTVLLTARPFRVGERVRLQGGMVAGQIEGVVSSLGLLYTTFATGEDTIMVPNSVVLSVAVRPLREPDAVSLRARLAPGMTPGDMQEALEAALTTPLRSSPRITLEEFEAGQAVVQISATPSRASDGRQLASELLELVAQQTGERPRDDDRGGGDAGRDPAAGGDGAPAGAGAPPVNAPRGT